jgi:hypothetical protein
MNCKLVGRWRIVEADIWDRQYLDLCGPATIIIRANGRGEIAFGALQAGLDIEYSRASVGFTWEGFDEMDEVSGDGSAELLDDGSIEIEFAFHNGDEAVLKANGRDRRGRRGRRLSRRTDGYKTRRCGTRAR